MTLDQPRPVLLQRRLSRRLYDRGFRADLGGATRWSGIAVDCLHPRLPDPASVVLRARGPDMTGNLK